MQIKKITDLISNTTEQSLPSCIKSEILSSFENFNPEKYAKEYMESTSSVHLSPTKYRRRNWDMNPLELILC